MSDWTDPDIRNHVKEESILSIGRFLENFSFKSKTEANKTYPYKLKDVYKTYDILYSMIDFDKFYKYTSRIKELSKEYESFAETSNCKPMKDSFYTYNKNPQLYQFLLIANNLWNSLEYNSDIGKVKVPSKSLLTNMLRDLLIENNYRYMKELTNDDEIREAIQKDNSAEEEYTLSKVISEKLYMDEDKVEKRYKSPLIKEYLSSKINQLINNNKDSDEEILNEKINDLFKSLRQYIKDTSSEVD